MDAFFPSTTPSLTLFDLLVRPRPSRVSFLTTLSLTPSQTRSKLIFSVVGDIFRAKKCESCRTSILLRVTVDSTAGSSNAEEALNNTGDLNTNLFPLVNSSEARDQSSMRSYPSMCSSMRSRSKLPTILYSLNWPSRSSISMTVSGFRCCNKPEALF